MGETPFVSRSLPESVPPAELYGYQLAEIDHGAGALWDTFSVLDGQGPHGTLVEMAARKENVAVLDAGCGTGNQLRELLEQARQQGVDLEDVYADGVNLHDFSASSRHQATRDAIENEDITYCQSDITNNLLPHGAYDLVYSYDVFGHLSQPNAALNNLWQALAPGGVLYGNVSGDHPAKISTAILDIQRQGGLVSMREAAPTQLERMRAGRTGVLWAPSYIFKIVKLVKRGNADLL